LEHRQKLERDLNEIQRELDDEKQMKQQISVHNHQDTKKIIDLEEKVVNDDRAVF
jgi:hypothetical protein